MISYHRRWVTTDDLQSAIERESAHYGWHGADWREWRVACLQEDNEIIHRAPTARANAAAAITLNCELIAWHRRAIAAA